METKMVTMFLNRKCETKESEHTDLDFHEVQQIVPACCKHQETCKRILQQYRQNATQRMAIYSIWQHYHFFPVPQSISPGNIIEIHPLFLELSQTDRYAHKPLNTA